MFLKTLTKSLLIILISIIIACDDDTNSDNSFSWPGTQGAKLPFEVLKTVNGDVEVRNGGYGSASTAHPSRIDEGYFYALTDRGPNANYADGKKFPVSEYTPRIGLFKMNEDGQVDLERAILLKNPAGANISGLPNPEGKGATGEIPYDNEGNPLSFDDYGLDAEGLVALANGEFWVSDEYGPHIVHYSADGIEKERISPMGINEGNGGRKIPRVYGNRRANRGMEGLAITPDENILVGIMQSTMYNPSNSGATNRTVTRIVTLNLSTGEYGEYLYRQDKNNNSNSEITALSATEFLVIERDGGFAGEDATVQKKIYKINLSSGTNIAKLEGYDADAELGFMIGDNTIEASSWEEINSAGINEVDKTEVADLVAINGYPHDKLEGIVIISPTKLGVINDDDFVVGVEDGNVIQKILPGSTNEDASTIYTIDVNKLY